MVPSSSFKFNVFARICLLIGFLSLNCKDDKPELLLAAFFGESEVAIKVTRPYEGEAWPKGTRQTIQWQTQKQYNRFDIFLYKGATTVRTVAVNVPDSSRFAWDVPMNIVSDPEYRIRIVGRGTDAYLVSQSGLFQIYTP